MSVKIRSLQFFPTAVNDINKILPDNFYIAVVECQKFGVDIHLLVEKYVNDQNKVSHIVRKLDEGNYIDWHEHTSFDGKIKRIEININRYRD